MKLNRVMLILSVMAFIMPCAHGQYLQEDGSALYAGPIYDIRVEGHYAYCRSQHSFQIISIASLDTPLVVSGHVFNFCGGLALRDNYAFLTGGSGYNEINALEIYDISDPLMPYCIGILDSTWFLTKIALSGQYAFICSEYGSIAPFGLNIIDISDMSNPLPAGGLYMPHINNISIRDFYAFLATDISFVILDVSNPTAPVVVSDIPTAGSANDVSVIGSYAYVAGSDFLKTYDISNPSNPQLIADTTLGRAALSVYSEGNYIYISTYTEINIFDISNPGLPTLVRSISNYYLINDIDVQNRIAFCADYYQGLRIVDLSGFAHPQERGRCFAPYNLTGITIDGNYLFASDSLFGLFILNNADPEMPIADGIIWAGDLFDFCIKDTLVMMLVRTEIGNRFVIYDISDSHNPAYLGACEVGAQPYAISIRGNYAYTAQGSDGVVIFDISTPSRPTQVGQYQDGSSAKAIAIRDTLAYVGYDGFKILNISNPVNPTPVGEWIYGLSAEDIFLDGNYAYLAFSGFGFWIIDISNLQSPQQLGGYYSGHAWPSIAVLGSYAYIPDRQSGIHIVDISNPALPLRASIHDTPGLAQGVFMSDSALYLADYSSMRFFHPVATSRANSDNNLPSKPIILENYPNPFNAQTIIKYALNENGLVTLSIYNINGRKITTLVDGIQYAGEHRLEWHALKYPSGIYFARLQYAGNSQIRKLILLK